jgi:hypothetical protein
MAEDSDDEDEGLGLSPLELKKFIKLGRSKELTFAFVPAGGTEEPLFTVHRRKKPDVLGKAARKEAEETRFACGRMKVDGKTLVLTCDKVVPGMQRKLQKMLRGMKLPLEVRVTGPGGEEIG